MKYGLERIPFSAYGSYFVISKESETGKLHLRDVHGGDEAPSLLYEIEMAGHRIGETKITRTETVLSIKSKKGKGQIRITFGAADTVHVVTEDAALTLRAVGGKYDTLVPLSERRCEHHLYAKQLKIMFTCAAGAMTQSQQWDVIGSKDAVITVESGSYLVLESYKAVWQPKEYASFAETAAASERSFKQWQSRFANNCNTFSDSHRLASYITWMNVVHQEGQLSADAMYMSKNWMYNIWSWDNCFGGIALSQSMPELACGQFRIFMDHQDASGCYPDYVNETFASYNCVKPPIHGWAFQKMLAQNDWFADEEIMRSFYQSLSGVTSYWCEYRRNEKAEFPVYYHGNDSGWDNASVFHRGFPVESPDLTAFLIYQMDVLHDLGQRLDLSKAAEGWKRQADEWFSRFMAHFYRDGQFRAFHVPSGEWIVKEQSLLMYMPLLIGYRMEERIVQNLVRRLLESYETAFGLATEAPGSPYYQKAGYWLGPIWAPTTYLLIDALRNNGYPEFARRLAEKFCRLTQVGLMAENYDPFTGEGYDDPAFSWPSCVLLQLLYEYNDLEEA